MNKKLILTLFAASIGLVSTAALQQNFNSVQAMENVPEKNEDSSQEFEKKSKICLLELQNITGSLSYLFDYIIKNYDKKLGPNAAISDTTLKIIWENIEGLNKIEFPENFIEKYIGGDKDENLIDFLKINLKKYFINYTAKTTVFNVEDIKNLLDKTRYLARIVKSESDKIISKENEQKILNKRKIKK